MAEAPDLAPAYRYKLTEMYETNDKLKNPGFLKVSKNHLIRLLDEVETQLKETAYVAGEEFSMADVILIPVLERLALLNLEEYLGIRPNASKYWIVVKQRDGYKKVIGKHFNGWRTYKTLVKTWCCSYQNHSKEILMN